MYCPESDPMMRCTLNMLKLPGWIVFQDGTTLHSVTDLQRIDADDNEKSIKIVLAEKLEKFEEEKWKEYLATHDQRIILPKHVETLGLDLRNVHSTKTFFLRAFNGNNSNITIVRLMNCMGARANRTTYNSQRGLLLHE